MVADAVMRQTICCYAFDDAIGFGCPSSIYLTNIIIYILGCHKSVKIEYRSSTKIAQTTPGMSLLLHIFTGPEMIATYPARGPLV